MEVDPVAPKCLSPSCKRRRRGNAAKRRLWQLAHMDPGVLLSPPKLAKNSRRKFDTDDASRPATEDKTCEGTVFSRQLLLAYSFLETDLKAETIMRADAPEFIPLLGYAAHGVVFSAYEVMGPSGLASDLDGMQHELCTLLPSRTKLEAPIDQHTGTDNCQRCGPVVSDSSTTVVKERCCCDLLICRTCQKLAIDCECHVPALAANVCEACGREYFDCCDELFCGMCRLGLHACRCEAPLLLERLGECSLHGEPAGNHSFTLQVNWIINNDCPCAQCRLILTDPEQERCEAAECVAEELQGGPQFFHETCMVDAGGALLCRACHSLGRQPYEPSETESEEGDHGGVASVGQCRRELA
eukprot:TRINITY_DN22577_c0_g1_i1.p1 TRINITY_DN22577_c0_g1~~TRINITY_DN22577_c0_g1_i1.p1  ORF type:complete len:357 (+),score=49.01 TRINITY_DN22577_c0_g1_i1:71-1141(+)